MKHDWKKIKTEYLKGNSNKDICKKHSIKENTLNSKIQRENWRELRTEIEQKTHSKTTDKISESLSDIQSKWVKKQFEFFEEYFDDEVSKYKSLKHSPDYKPAMADLKEAVRMARQAINLFDSKTESTGNMTVVNKYKELTKEEIQEELVRRGLSTDFYDK